MSQQSDSMACAELKSESSPGLDLLSTAALIDSQKAYEAAKMFDNSQTLYNLMSQEVVNKMHLTRKLTQSSQSYLPSSDFDFISLSPDENSSDTQEVTSYPEIFTNAKKFSVDDYYKESKKEKQTAHKQVANPEKRAELKLDKRERNRIAARKLREKRKQEQEIIKKEIGHWEKRLKALEKKFKHLSVQKDKYLSQLPTLKLDKKTLKGIMERINSINLAD